MLLTRLFKYIDEIISLSVQSGESRQKEENKLLKENYMHQMYTTKACCDRRKSINSKRDYHVGRTKEVEGTGLYPVVCCIGCPFG